MLTAVELKLATLLQYDPAYEWRGGNKALIDSTEPEVIAEGPSECLAGETQIYDPVSNRSFTIEYLWENGIAPYVMTLYGPRKATAPFRKGHDALYRITLSNGYSFLATKKHRVLTNRGWFFVGSLQPSELLLGCAERHQVSTWVSSLSMSLQDALHCARKSQDYQVSYSAYFHQCDELPPKAKDSALFCVQSPTYVLERIRDGHNLGGCGLSQEHSRHHQLSFHPSTFHWRHRDLLLKRSCEEYCYSQDSISNLPYDHLKHDTFQTGIYPLGTFGELGHRAKHIQNHEKLTYQSPFSSDYTVFACTLSNIEYVRDDYYYDLTVPEAGHYLAEGIWHHNTGKTMAACYKMHYNCREYPKSQHTLIRKVAATIPGTVLGTMKRIIGNFPVNWYGGEHNPEMIIYPNGSTIWIAGMDKPGKALSGERDTIQVCQAEELSIDDWETLTTRVTGRGSVMPYTQIFGDCNPGAARWLKDRQKSGALQMIPTRHEDNPSLFTADGKLTMQGIRSMARLDALTGTRHKRLRLGLWVSAEGAIYEEYDANIHMIDADKCPEFVRRFRVVDFGYTNPFVCQWWGMDADGRLYRYREIYVTKKLVEDLTAEIIRLTGDEPIEFTLADHDAEDRATMERHGISTYPAVKDVSPGIQAVQTRLKVQGDGKARLFFVRGALVEVDQALQEAHKPTCTEDEMPEYVWQKYPDDKPNKEQPLKINDHGCDTTRYMVAKLDGLPSDPSKMIDWA